MKKLILGLSLALAAIVVTPTTSHAKAASKDKGEASTTPAMSKEDQQKLREHTKLRDHIIKDVKYPATKQELVTACKGFSGVKAGDKQWVEETLSDKTYASSDEVEKALGWEVSPPVPAKTAKK